MGRQLRLVLVLLLAVVTCQLTVASTPSSFLVHDDIKDNELDTSDEHVEPLKSVKISTPKVAKANVPEDAPKQPLAPTPAPTSTSKPTAAVTPTPKPTPKAVSDEIMSDLIEASKHSSALADDLRFHKLKEEKATASNNKIDKKDYIVHDDFNDDDEDDEYKDDDFYDAIGEDKEKIGGSTEKQTVVKSEPAKTNSEVKQSKSVEMKPIKEDDKVASKPNKGDDKDNDLLNDDDYDDDDDDDDDDYNDDDDNDNEEDANDDNDIADEEEVVFSENVPCPRYCVCARNINSYLVATCSRLDLGTQKFGSDITDLIVTDVEPKYPILLGPEFFSQMGLKHVSSIKISNCTIEYLHPAAFHGLDELYSLNLTNVGLAIINPDTFAKNKKLRLLTISGNDLSVMSTVHYLLKSSSIEELDLSRNNLVELNPNAFTQLSNIVYINLSQNNLQTIPNKIFDPVSSIEELDLSYNSLKTLPPGIFNRTALSILHLKYNLITGDLRFGTNDLQQLDLSFNSINHVHHGMFDKMTGLTNLNLKGNGIIKIQPDSFLMLKMLRHIDLSINELDQISSMLFYKNSELGVIRLNDNPRLSQLPTDGFLNYNGYFTAHYLDVSNCAIGALGHKTFSTMPHLVTLKLAWNNINNLERDTFESLTKLIDLDLSNNLIARMDELMFMSNNELTKLNLAGNPIHKLSIRLFLPLTKLRELDVSDCELTSLMTDNQFGVGRKYKFYESLRSFNASANQIKRISSNDIRSFKNLHTLDISKNPLKCNEEFQDFIAYASVKSHMVPHKIPVLENMDTEDIGGYLEVNAQAGWAELAHEVCKHLEDRLHSKSKGEKLDKLYEQADKDLYEDEKDLQNIMETSKINKLKKILKDSRKSEVVVSDRLNDDHVEDSEEDMNNASERKDKAEDKANQDEYDDDDDDEEDDSEYDDESENESNEDDSYDNFDKKEKNKQVDEPKLIDHGVKVEQVELNKETRDKFLLDKFLLNGDDVSDNSQEEEIIIERGHIYYRGLRFLVPIIVLLTCVLVLLLIIAKVVSVVMRKRGERYRMALLASSKNSIVYQKLSEDIKPPSKEPKQPKVHKYSPVNQV